MLNSLFAKMFARRLWYPINPSYLSLGGWETPDMVSRYAARLTFDEALKLYSDIVARST